MSLYEYLNETMNESAFNDNQSKVTGSPFSPEFATLRIFFKNYYATYQECDGTLCYLQGDPIFHLTDRKSSSFNMRYYVSIVFVSHFFENIIKQLAYQISPELIKNDIDFKNLFSNHTQKPVDRAANISKIFSRIIQLYSTDIKYPKQLKAPIKFKFLVKHKEAIETLFSIRNDVIHSGTKIPYLYKYDYFIINKIIPAINDYCKVYDLKKNFDRNIFIKKSIFKELLKIKLPKNINSDQQKTIEAIKKVIHLKALGFAAFSNKIYTIHDIHKNGSYYQRKKHLQNINLLNKAKYEIMVREFSSYWPNSKIEICLCCGLNSLFFKPWNNIPTGKTVYLDGNCISCGYEIKNGWGSLVQLDLYHKDLCYDKPFL